MKKQGYFSSDFTTYTITDMFPPRPWYNFLWNKNFIAQLDQFGMGNSWHYSDSGIRSNHNCNGSQSDLCTITDNRIIFIRDNDNETQWAANRNYNSLPFEEFKTVVGLGFSEIISKYSGIKTSFKIFVPEDGSYECWQIKIKNCSDKIKNISCFPYANSSLGSLPHAACSHGFFAEELNGVILENNGPNLHTKLTKTFFASDVKPVNFETTNRRFRGVYGTIANPDAVVDGNLSSKGTSFDWQMITALQFDYLLKPGEEKIINIISGIAESLDEISKIKNKYSASEIFNTELDKILKNNIETSQNVVVLTGDKHVDALANYWLKRQISLGKTWGRVYGKGFRDIMQDCTAVVSFDPAAAKENMISCFEHQYENGNTLRQWNPTWKHPYRDGAVWIFPAVTGYLKETGDFDFLNVKVGFLDSDKSDTILNHCFKGMYFLLDNLGENGLCLWGGGDWNDSLDAAGIEGKGESVWLSEATVFSAKLFVELLRRINRKDDADIVLKKADELANSITKNAWDKDHFLMGINDKNEKIGSYDSDEAKIFLNTQTWAVLAEITGAGNDLLDLVEKELQSPFGVVLAKPAFSKGNKNIGLATFMDKGCCENGSVYNHGVAFKIAADCKLGRSEQAYKSLKKLLPGNPENPDSGVEPYVVVNQYLGLENPYRAGEANGTWITGTAGWTYRCITEYMIGIQADYDGLKIKPCLPAAWKEVNITRQFRNRVYKIKIINNGGKYKIKVNGEEIENGIKIS